MNTRLVAFINAQTTVDAQKIIKLLKDSYYGNRWATAQYFFSYCKSCGIGRCDDCEVKYKCFTSP